jgi:hypothetical protein
MRDLHRDFALRRNKPALFIRILMGHGRSMWNGNLPNHREGLGEVVSDPGSGFSRAWASPGLSEDSVSRFGGTA